MAHLIDQFVGKFFLWKEILVLLTAKWIVLVAIDLQTYGHNFWKWSECISVRNCHDDVIKWKHFPRHWPFVRAIHRSPVNSPHKGQWRGALMFSVIWLWINVWVNNRDAGDLICHRAHYDVIAMMQLWMSRFIRCQGGRSAKEANGVRLTLTPSVETTFWSRFCKVQTVPRHMSGEILQLIMRRSCEGRRQGDVARITGVAQGTISKILKQTQPGDCPFVTLRSTDMTTVRRVWHGLKQTQTSLWSH